MLLRIRAAAADAAVDTPRFSSFLPARAQTRPLPQADVDLADSRDRPFTGESKRARVVALFMWQCDSAENVCATTGSRLLPHQTIPEEES